MNNLALNTLTYTGIVTLSQCIGSKKIKVAQYHNTGGASLFRFLSYCLAGDFTLAMPRKPAKIKVLRYNTNSKTYESATQLVTLRTPPEPINTDGESRVRFSFIIPRDTISGKLATSNSEEVVGLGLYANNITESDAVDNFMAFCPITDADELSGSLANAFLAVDWELIISNSGSNTTYQ